VNEYYAQSLLVNLMLNLRVAGFDLSLASIVGKMSQNGTIRKLCIGRNLAGIKQR